MLIRLKTTTLRPMPSASDTTTTRAAKRFRPILRSAKRSSCISFPIDSVLVSFSPVAGLHRRRCCRRQHLIAASVIRLDEAVVELHQAVGHVIVMVVVTNDDDRLAAHLQIG